MRTTAPLTDLVTFGKILGVAVAIGLDVFAVSIAVGIAGIPWNARIRLGAAFSCAEIGMQLLGFVLGSGFGRVIGAVAPYVGFAILAAVGVFMIRQSLVGEDAPFHVRSGIGLLVASLSISLDSLGVGFALPGVPLPLAPLLVTVAFTTIVFTFVGLAFGARLGTWLEKSAERAAGAVLVLLAVLFTAQHLMEGRI